MTSAILKTGKTLGMRLGKNQLGGVTYGNEFFCSKEHNKILFKYNHFLLRFKYVILITVLCLIRRNPLF